MKTRTRPLRVWLDEIVAMRRNGMYLPAIAATLKQLHQVDVTPGGISATLRRAARDDPALKVLIGPPRVKGNSKG